jgi:hypothetical protein
MKQTILFNMIILALITLASVFLLMQLVQRDTTNTNSDSGYGKICLDGVVYWRGYQQLAVKFKSDGTVELCK